MKKLIFNSLIPAIVATTLLISSCEKDENNTGGGAYLYGSNVFVTCEGPFVGGTGSVSAYNRDRDSVSNDLFMAANGTPLGNIVQSMAINGSSAYIVVNNANKIKVVNKNTFVQTAEITGISQPRYMIVKNNKGYLTEWGTGSTGNVKVIDLNSNTITATIPVGEGPEWLLEHNGKIYVCNSGAFNTATTVSVIDLATNAVTATVNVGTNPTGIVADKNGKLWVVCNGTFGGNNGTIEKINTTTNLVETSIPLNADGYQTRLSINITKDKMYFNLGGVVKQLDVATETVSTFISRNAYSLACDRYTNNIWLSDAGDFQSNGKIIRYNITSAAAVDSFEVGVIPGNFCFE